MIKELFANACILFTSIFIVSRLMKKYDISTSSPIQTRTIYGIIGGIGACILMIYSSKITPQVMLDFRDIDFILIAYFGGLIPTIITGIVASAFLLFYRGITDNTLISVLGMVLICTGSGMISKFKLRMNIKIILMLLYSLLVNSMVYIIIVKDMKELITILLCKWITSIVIIIATFHYINYLIDSKNMLISLKKESTHDYITGLSNTRRFDTKYNDALKNALVNKGKVALCIIDIDHFKKINDNYGHTAGSEVLKQLGILMKKECGQQFFIARIGGEEFAIILKNTDPVNVKKVAEHLRKEIENHNFTISNSNVIRITVSIGVAQYPDLLNDITYLKEAADNKLYEAKRTGRNKVCI